ncbi:hypothetical protein G5B38_02760 [Pseudohalocynthiibacter aestuariivivens]|nr:hypothetical protein [Pseudohalocynthiibacter aestuariivivens]QIE44535.1 hypothetical protein G5B38_02760 [Pseudohalocynthiibacter aestuariivivens]
MIADIWHSFRSLPLWVQIWVFGILVPVNAAAILWVDAPYGGWVAALAIGGMLPNVWIMWRMRGFPRSMAVPHVLVWTPLVALLVWLLSGLVGASDGYIRYLWLLLAVDLISLGFDYVDTYKWLRDR